ncbi:T9SS type A sorting domain-containing protein [Hanstruepera marina]|uniref:T9SS type A sorting domain-containing protein n=1 Tax=Hanstruepera marina TaxID=2873265 RepID=UPI001CA73A47|nr:T9SS type A sorting domain-containing protein [Hanstruepera marina]
MKKTTYCLSFLLFLFVSWQGISQTLNQNAGWPNASWSVTGTYNTDPTAFEADPRTTSNFAFDDDDAGNGNDDDIAAESPVIDITAAFNAGETWLTVAVDFTYNDLADTLTLEYWDADAGIWVIWETFVGTSDQPQDNFCSGTRDSFISIPLNIAGFTANQQSNFQYRINFLDDGGAGGAAWEWGFCFESPTITSAVPPSCFVPGNLMAAATDVTADLSWDDDAGATLGYEWVVLATDGDPDTDTAIDSGSTGAGIVMDTATGLSISTTYYAFVRANCDANGYSDWSPSTSFTTLAAPPPSNDLCANATVLTCNTPLTGQTTVAASGGSATSCVGTIGDDVWYQLTGTDMDVVLTVTASVEEPQVEVYESTDGTCAGITPGTCFAAGGSGENPVEVSFTALAGNEYFIRVGNWINGDPGVEFEIEAACTPIQPAPDCAMEPIMPTNGETDVSAFGTISLTWTAPASGPTPTSYDVYAGLMSDGSDLALVANTTDTFLDGNVGAYDTTIYWMVVPLNATTPATGCPLWSFTSESAPPPPGNDDCAGAVALTPGVAFADNAINGNNESATASEVGDPTIPAPGCSSYLGGDVWYSVVVPADGNLTIETNGNPVGNGGDTGMAVYSGACGSLALVACDDDASDDGFYSLISISDTNLAGQTLYVRIFEYGNNDIVFFQISAYSATLSVDDFENTSIFTYYPNPVSNTLTLNAQKDIQNIVVYNMLGQQVMKATPDAVSSEVDMSSLKTGSYFVQVTIDDTVETIRIIKN